MMHLEHAIVIMRHVGYALAYLGSRKTPPSPWKRDASGALRISTTQLVEGRHCDWSEKDVAQAITRPKALAALLEITAEAKLGVECEAGGVFVLRRLE
jgi:hypothetical protein